MRLSGLELRNSGPSLGWTVMTFPPQPVELLNCSTAESWGMSLLDNGGKGVMRSAPEAQALDFKLFTSRPGAVATLT
jgi:hypothetical protein